MTGEVLAWEIHLDAALEVQLTQLLLLSKQIKGTTASITTQRELYHSKEQQLNLLITNLFTGRYDFDPSRHHMLIEHGYLALYDETEVQGGVLVPHAHALATLMVTPRRSELVNRKLDECYTAYHALNQSIDHYKQLILSYKRLYKQVVGVVQHYCAKQGDDTYFSEEEHTLVFHEREDGLALSFIRAADRERLETTQHHV